jgi:hypothetical protein
LHSSIFCLISFNFSLAVLEAAAALTASIISAAVVVVDFVTASEVGDNAPPRVLAMSNDNLLWLVLVLVLVQLIEVDLVSPGRR